VKLIAGLRWAFSQLGLDVVELAALLHIMVYDRAHSVVAHDGRFDFFELYLTIIIACCVLQFLGIFLVNVKYYRLGGIVQILASAPNVVKGEGLIGVIGGIKAYNYPRTLRDADSNAAPSVQA